MKLIQTISIAVLSLTLVACGGGGGGGSDPGAGTTPSSGGSTGGTTSTSWVPAVTSVAAATYASDNLTVYQMLNSSRQAAGAGLLTQNAALDKAALAHAQYLLQNWNATALADFHDENSSNTGFTGATPSAQMSAAGYSGVSMGQVGIIGVAGITTPADCVNAWLNSVYHLQAIFGTETQVGIAAVGNDTGYVCVVDYGNAVAYSGAYGGQLPATTLVYPYAGQTNVATTFHAGQESPDPAPDIANSYPIGQPILVSAVDAAMAQSLPNSWQASQVTINAFTVTAKGGSTPLATRIVVPGGTLGAAGVTVTTDVAGEYSGLAYVLPLAPLAPNTAYNVSFSATVAGKSVNDNWSFTTGSGN